MLEKRAQAGDDGDRDMRGRKSPEREQPLMDCGTGRGSGFEGHRLALGEREHALFAEPSGELGSPTARAVLARRHECDSSCVLRDERRPRERPRPRVRVGHDEALPILET